MYVTLKERFSRPKNLNMGGVKIESRMSGCTSGFRSWLGVEDSNLGIQIQSLLSYH